MKSNLKVDKPDAADVSEEALAAEKYATLGSVKCTVSRADQLEI